MKKAETGLHVRETRSRTQERRRRGRRNGRITSCSTSSVSRRSFFRFPPLRPITNKKEINLQLARQTISIIEMLKEKTKGNLTEEEENLLDSVLYDVRLKFLGQAR
jgi:hypothetical protein